MKNIIFLLGFSFFTLILSAQQNYFTDSLFIEELGDFMSKTYSAHSENEQIFLDFETNWESGNLDNNKFGIVYAANSMRNSYAKAFPDFSYYLLTLNGLVEKNDADFYMEWEVGFLEVIETNKLQKIRNYLKISKSLIVDSVLVQTASITWKTTSTDYVVGNDPATEEFFIQFNNEIDLICFNSAGRNVDTFVVKNTVGICYPASYSWHGTSGKVTWQQANLDEASVYATFGEYELNMKQSRFAVEDALFTNEDIKVHKIPGKLEVKLSQTLSLDNRPVFISDNLVLIKDLLPDTDFFGYLTMIGNKITGSGKDEAAVMYINDKGKNVAILSSNRFDIYPNESVVSNSVEAVFYFNNHNDSLWQNNLDIKYVTKLDSIMFPPDKFSFYSENDIFLLMSRSSDGINMSPIIDSYHQMQIFADKIVWHKRDSLLYFVTTKASSVDYVLFESLNYFNQNDYNYFSGQNSDHINHLAEIKILYQKISKNGNLLMPETYQIHITNTRKVQLSINSIETLFQKLSYSGFVYYNRKINYIIPNEKLYRYISNASRIRLKKKQITTTSNSTIELQDFDKLSLMSQIGNSDYRVTNLGINATMNLQNFSLNINHLKPFRLSPTVKIYAEQVVVNKNRDMKFGGQVGAGLVMLSGSKFKFNYDDYKIEFNENNTSMQMWTIDTVGNRVFHTPVSTVMKDIKGNIYINEDDNKSNTIIDENYPKLVTDNQAKIYYENFASKFTDGKTDSLSLANFNKDFYFEADNFDEDSLNYISNSTLEFEGVMHTGLFDSLHVTLSVKINPNNGTQSLGFTECTDEKKELAGGLAFKGGLFFGCFSLNDGGLFGDGYITYESSYVRSNNFAFIPDQVLGLIDSFAINPLNQSANGGLNEDIPYIIGKNTFFDWKHKMIFSKDNRLPNNEIILYSDKLDNPGNLDGTLFYSKDSVSGNGIFKFEDADIIDTVNFMFKYSSFSTQVCDFNLKVNKTDAFKTKNLNGNVLIDEKLGSFYSNNDTSHILFPENYYYCVMDHFLWKIGEGIVNIGGVMPGKDSTNYVTTLEEKADASKNNIDVKLYGTILVATADSLKFNASSTTYLLEDKIIIADDVEKIKIADAMIYPKGTVTIQRGGKIDTLKNKSLEYPYKLFAEEQKGNYIHYFENADIIISNRFNYTALHPKYYYKYEMQPIIFDKIFVKDAPNYLPIKKQSKFTQFGLYSYGAKVVRFGYTLDLSQDFIFGGQGRINVIANNKFLQFEGYVRMDTTCNTVEAPVNEFSIFPVIINPDSVELPVNITGVKGRRVDLKTGLFWETTMINKKTAYTINRSFLDNIGISAEPIFEVGGVAYYNSKAGEYRIGDKEKVYNLNPDTIVGNLISYNKDLCIVKAQGEFDLLQNWDVQNRSQVDHIKSTFRGYYRCNLNGDGKHKFQGSWALDFIAPDKIMDDLADKIILGYNNPPLLDEKDRMKKNYYAFLGNTKTDAIFYEIENFFEYDMPRELKHTIMFSDINLVWSADSSSLVSQGKLGIATINGITIDRYVEGYVKYKNTKKFRLLVIIIEPIPNIIYAFKYRYTDNRGVMKFYTKTNNPKIDNYFVGLKNKDKKFNNYFIEQTSEDEFRTFAKEYIH